MAHVNNFVCFEFCRLGLFLVHFGDCWFLVLFGSFLGLLGLFCLFFNLFLLMPVFPHWVGFSHFGPFLSIFDFDTSLVYYGNFCLFHVYSCLCIAFLFQFYVNFRKSLSVS